MARVKIIMKNMNGLLALRDKQNNASVAQYDIPLNSAEASVVVFPTTT